MTSDPSKMTCAEFQAQLADLIGSGEDASAHPHVKNCPLCQALLHDLETIAAAARDLFSSAEPPDDLWNHIETAIENDTQKDGQPHPPAPLR
jgi:hypothetical protein